MTALTDLVLAAILLALACYLNRSGCRSARPSKTLGASFVLLSISFLFGGLEHGLALDLRCGERQMCMANSWLGIVSLLTQAPALSSAVVASAQLVLRSKHKRWLLAAWCYCVFNTVFYTVAVAMGIFYQVEFLLGFVMVIVFVVPSALAILVLLSLPVCCCAYGRRPRPDGSATALIGWIVCIVSLAWQATGIGLHAHFNHNDIFHVVFMVGVIVFGVGIDGFARSNLAARSVVPASKTKVATPPFGQTIFSSSRI